MSHAFAAASPIRRHYGNGQGFTLVELSIVLVILGLLVGGVLTGQSLIRAAELRSVTADFNRFSTAMNAFRDKYFAVPGDMTNATAFWGTAGGTGSNAACYNTASTTSATCNGNGNGLIEWDPTLNFFEVHRAWQHLANAGLIEGQYSGQANVQCVAGGTCPRSKISGAGYSLIYIAYGGSFGESFSAASNGNHLVFGKYADITRQTILKPEEAWNIDTKMDDGRPDQGIVQTDTSVSSACFTGTYPSAAYALSLTSIACALHFTMR